MKSFDGSILMLAVACAAWTVGCGGTSETPVGDGTKPETTSDELAGCSAPSMVSGIPESEDAYYLAAEGAWRGCPSYEAEPSFGAPAPEEVGIELSGDGTYALLLRAPDGSITPSTDVDQKGTWYVSTNDGMNTIPPTMAVSDSGGTSFFRPTFHDDAHQLRIEEGMWLFHWKRYVSVSLP